MKGLGGARGIRIDDTGVESNEYLSMERYLRSLECPLSPASVRGLMQLRDDRVRGEGTDPKIIGVFTGGKRPRVVWFS